MFPEIEELLARRSGLPDSDVLLHPIVHGILRTFLIFILTLHKTLDLNFHTEKHFKQVINSSVCYSYINFGVERVPSYVYHKTPLRNTP